jgi:hypothetical protein
MIEALLDGSLMTFVGCGEYLMTDSSSWAFGYRERREKQQLSPATFPVCEQKDIHDE